ncbi:MAG: hypothetical protein M3069_28150, partial [Chloroflexota bacterium]|nr:hypothetical protein [Chloroflexota bacterium]
MTVANQLAGLIANLAPDKRSLLADLLRPVSEPIAIIGMACRFPGGVTTPDAFWDVLRDGRDVVGEVPPERWDV